MEKNIKAKEGTEELKLYTKIMRAANSVTERMHKHLLKEKLSVSQFGVLEALYNLGPLCQKDLGSKILKTSGNITMVIDNLEKRKLVQRVKNPEDRRKLTINLTKQGLKVIEKVFPQHRKTALDVFSVLSSKEKEIFGELLKKVGKTTS